MAPNAAQHYIIQQHISFSDRDRDIYSEPVGTNNVFSFSRDLSMITGVFLYPSLKRSRPDEMLYTPTVIVPGAWRNSS